jgi:hypothetical protein
MTTNVLATALPPPSLDGWRWQFSRGALSPIPNPLAHVHPAIDEEFALREFGYGPAFHLDERPLFLMMLQRWTPLTLRYPACLLVWVAAEKRWLPVYCVTAHDALNLLSLRLASPNET